MAQRSQLETSAFARNERVRSDLMLRLQDIEKVIRSGDHIEAGSRLNTYELAVKWSQPLLSRMIKVEDQTLRGGPECSGSAIASLQEVENKIILEDYLGADDALKKLEAMIEEPLAIVESTAPVPSLSIREGSGHGDIACGLCGAGITPGSIMCPVCGYDMESAIVECASCGRRVSEAFNNCPFCGAVTSMESKK
jgi:hypothetical protein